MSNNGKFINLENGKLKQNDAINVSTGVGDSDKLVKLDSTGKLDLSMLPVGVGPDVKVAVCSDNLVAGQYVNFWNDGGIEKVRLADASNGRDAHGFVIDAFATGASATVYFEGGNDNLSALTPGTRYYLNTAGGVTDVQRTTGIHQFLGIAVSTTAINTDIDDCVVL